MCIIHQKDHIIFRAFRRWINATAFMNVCCYWLLDWWCCFQLNGNWVQIIGDPFISLSAEWLSCKNSQMFVKRWIWPNLTSFRRIFIQKSLLLGICSHKYSPNMEFDWIWSIFYVFSTKSNELLILARFLLMNTV